jgi:hypothetical protein
MPEIPTVGLTYYKSGNIKLKNTERMEHFIRIGGSPTSLNCTLLRMPFKPFIFGSILFFFRLKSQLATHTAMEEEEAQNSVMLDCAHCSSERLLPPPQVGTFCRCVLSACICTYEVTAL